MKRGGWDALAYPKPITLIKCKWAKKPHNTHYFLFCVVRSTIMKISLMTQEQFAIELQEQVQGGASISDIMHLLQQWAEKEDFEAVTRPASN